MACWKSQICKFIDRGGNLGQGRRICCVVDYKSLIYFSITIIGEWVNRTQVYVIRLVIILWRYTLVLHSHDGVSRFQLFQMNKSHFLTKLLIEFLFYFKLDGDFGIKISNGIRAQYHEKVNK